MAVMTYGQAYMSCVERVWCETMDSFPSAFWETASKEYDCYREQLDDDYDFFSFDELINDYGLDVGKIWQYMNEMGFNENSHWTDTVVI